ncbi:MAG TPA: hypothetical protein DEF34_04875 [Desulfotomaculum sp.]|nr:MAG: hypothetical protein JL56_13650 [Desulfotomaculum sp. BICA1-6]HBX22951.1 hypothetical protein [Desulfotomaculum sp.]
MKIISITVVVIFTIFFWLAECGSKNNVKQINAENFTISYGMSTYKAQDKMEQEIVDALVKDYNNIKLDGTTNEEINYDKAITIIFINNDQISGQVTVDDKRICRIEGNKDSYTISEESNIYPNALKVYQDLKTKP